MTTALKKRLTRFRHYSIISLIAIIVILVGVGYILQRTATTEAVVGEAGYSLKAQVRSTSAPPQLKEKDTWTQAELKAKVKEVIKESLSFRPVLEGLSCQQICEKAPGKYYAKITSECVARIIYFDGDLYNPDNSGFDVEGSSQTSRCESSEEYPPGFSSLCVCI